MSTAPTFGPQILGQTEKALNAILDRLLAGPGLTEPQWVTLSLAIAGDKTADRAQLTRQVTGALKISEPAARVLITELAVARLLQAPRGGGSPVTVTDAGQLLHRQIRTAVVRIAERLWGDLPTRDLAITGQVLSTILARADAEWADAALANAELADAELADAAGPPV